VTLVETRYTVPGWGAGELWVDDGVVLTHEFRFAVSPVGSKDRSRQAHPQAALALQAAAISQAAPHEGARVPPTCTLTANPSHEAHGFVATSRQCTAEAAEALTARVRGFLRGEPVDFDSVALDLSWATPFQHALAEILRSVPRGEVVSYGELAALAGRPGAARAAGAFCAANRFAFVVPCHRVVAADGIGGYGSSGLDVKRRLLALEGVVL
jgi:methylated-DNA-[protein]-cysteine S-methyltransferase